MANKQTGEGPSKIPQPKFFNIILCPEDCTSLKIPKDFASKYCKNMQTPAHLEVPSGQEWEVEVVHSKGQTWLAKGWKDFTDYYSIDCGHFLMFEYNGCSRFNVIIFDVTASEIEYPYNAAHGTRRVPAEQNKLNHSIEDSEDDVSVDTQGQNDSIEVIPNGHKGKSKISDLMEHSTENAGHNPLGQSSKTKRQQHESKDDDSVDVQDMDSPSFTRKNQKTSEGYKSKNAHDKNTTVMDKEKTEAYKRAEAFKSKNHFIKSCMQPSYVSSPFNLSVSLKFARKYFLENCDDLILRIRGKGSWSVKCCFGTGNAKIYSGWKGFVLENKLKVGDVCFFEVIEGTKLIDVTIFRAAGKDPAVTEQSVKILDHCPLGPGSKRKRQEGEAKDDVSINSRAKSIKLENSHEDEASRSFTRTKKSGEIINMHKQKSKGAYGKNKTVIDKETSIAYQKAKTFQSKNPFIISFMQPSYVSTPYILCIRLTFAKKYFGKNCNLVLRVPGSKGSWSVICYLKSKDARFSYAGWKEFVLDNKLKFGDVCIFEVIKGTQLFLDVTIVRAAESTAVHKLDRQVPGVSASTNKIIRTENAVPQSNSSGTVTAKEMVIAYQRAMAFTSENPFFICRMQPSYLSPSHGSTMQLYIPLSTARKFFGCKYSDVVLQVSSNRSWTVKCSIGTKNAKLGTGWKEFVMENNVKVGNVCVFELVSRAQLLFNVIIFDAAEGV